jgi:hypothetical protein
MQPGHDIAFDWQGKVMAHDMRCSATRLAAVTSLWCAALNLGN